MIPRPQVKGVAPWTFPLPAVSTLDNGLTIWAYDLPGQFIASVDLVLELPLNAEPSQYDGLGTITVRSLDESTSPHPGREFAAALEALGAHFGGLVGPSTTQCLLDVPCDNLDAALGLFAEAVTTPAFEAADVERIKGYRLAQIEQQQARGSWQAGTALRQALLDADLRIARPLGGGLESVSAIEADTVSAFHASHYTPKEATLIIAGDLRGLDAHQAVAKAFDSWNPPVTPTKPVALKPGIGGRQVIHREGAVQADIRLGWYGIDRHDPNWADLQVALAIMGGVFNSRLNTVLREERGYTYGVSMNAQPFRAGGTIEIATSTQTSTAKDLIEETLEIIAVKEGFSAEETAAAIGYLTLSAPLSLDTAEAVTAQGATLAAARLDLDYVTSALAALSKVTPSSAMEAYQRLVDPASATTVVVADTSELTNY